MWKFSAQNMLATTKLRKSSSARRSARLGVERLEPRMMLAADVSAALDDGLLSIEGSDSRDYVAIRTAERQTELVQGGVTSVALDLQTLEDVDLVLTGADGIVDNQFDTVPEDFAAVGFPIEVTSDFRFFPENGIVPVSGEIAHAGTVTFNGDTTIGNFDIGFDADRANIDFPAGTTTGFFVQDNVGFPGAILFDISLSNGGTVDFSSPNLTVENADLLVSPTLAGVLDNEGLIGADVGNAQINAVTVESFDEFIQVRGLHRTYVNGERSAEFFAADVESIDVDLGQASDYVSVYDVQLSGNLNLDLGSGYFNRAYVKRTSVEGLTSLTGGNYHDRISILHSDLGDLQIETFGGSDRVKLRGIHVSGDADVDLGSGYDRLNARASTIEGTASFDGGSGWDRIDAYFNSIGQLDQDGFERDGSSRFRWAGYRWWYR